MDEQEEFDYKTITMYLTYINVGFYVIAMIISGSLILMSDNMIVLFGFSTYTFQNGAYWTILTSIFFHAHLAHLLGNCLFLLIYGFNLEEKEIHWQNILETYLVAGIGSTILSVPFLGNAVTLGASGAIFGLLGLIVGMSVKLKNPEWKRTLFAGIIFFILATSANTNVFAHLFGLLIGIGIGYYSEFAFIKKQRIK